MGMVQLPEELQLVIERQVAEGRAVSPAAFLEEAVRRFVDESSGEEGALFSVVDTGSADIEAGRYTTVASVNDERHLYDGIMARLQARFSVED